jgi:hypothetical protein
MPLSVRRPIAVSEKAGVGAQGLPKARVDHDGPRLRAGDQPTGEVRRRPEVVAASGEQRPHREAGSSGREVANPGRGEHLERSPRRPG